MDLRWAGIACLLSVALAGCSGGASGKSDEADDVDFDELDLDATETTGIIRGVVVDEAIRPLAGAQLGLKVSGAEERTTTSNDAGAFGFDGLEPGTYFVQATKERHKPMQQSVEVVAGQDDPPVVKFVLESDGSPDPFYNVFAFEGYVECTTSFLVLCGAPNTLEPFLCEDYGLCYGNITNDRYTFTKYFVDNASLIQAEMTWESTQSLTPTMYFEMEALDGGDCPQDFLNNTQGHSPIYATVNATQVEEDMLGSACGIYFSLFSGHNEPLPRLPNGWGLGLTVQQEFTMYIHSFHGFMPPEGWRFTVDGDPQPPV